MKERRGKSATVRVRTDTAGAVRTIQGALSLGQADVARLCGVSAATVRAWTRGKSPRAYRHVLALARLLRRAERLRLSSPAFE